MRVNPAFIRVTAILALSRPPPAPPTLRGPSAWWLPTPPGGTGHLRPARSNPFLSKTLGASTRRQQPGGNGEVGFPSVSIAAPTGTRLTSSTSLLINLHTRNDPQLRSL